MDDFRTIDIDEQVVPAPAGQFLVQAEFDRDGYSETLMPVIGWHVARNSKNTKPILAHDSELKLTESFEWYEGEGYVGGVALWDATSDVYCFGEGRRLTFRGRGALESGLRRFYERMVKERDSE